MGESWQNIPFDVLDEEKRQNEAKAWGSEQRRQLAETWAEQQRQSFNRWLEERRKTDEKQPTPEPSRPFGPLPAGYYPQPAPKPEPQPDLSRSHRQPTLGERNEGLRQSLPGYAGASDVAGEALGIGMEGLELLRQKGIQSATMIGDAAGDVAGVTTPRTGLSRSNFDTRRPMAIEEEAQKGITGLLPVGPARGIAGGIGQVLNDMATGKGMVAAMDATALARLKEQNPQAYEAERAKQKEGIGQDWQRWQQETNNPLIEGIFDPTNLIPIPGAGPALNVAKQGLQATRTGAQAVRRGAEAVSPVLRNTAREMGPVARGLLAGERGGAELGDVVGKSEYAPTFYSQLERTIETKMGSSTSPKQLQGIMEEAGVNAKDISNSPLGAWLERKAKDTTKVSKAEVLYYIKHDSDIRQDAIAMYRDGAPQHEVANALGVSQASVGHWLKAAGVEVRPWKPIPLPAPKTTPEVKAAIVDRYTEGRKYRDIMGELRVTSSTINKALQEAGISARGSHPEGFGQAIRDEVVRLYSKEQLSGGEIARRLGISQPVANRIVRKAGITRPVAEQQSLRIQNRNYTVNRGISTPWYSTKNDEWSFADSSYELVRMSQLDSDPDVVSWTRKVGMIPYGNEQAYIPDLLIEHSDGRKVVEEIKPLWRMNDADVIAKANAARAYYEPKGIEYRLITQNDIGQDAIRNFDVDNIPFIAPERKQEIRRALRNFRTREQDASQKGQQLAQAQLGPALDIGGGAVGAASQYDPNATPKENAARMAMGGVVGAGLAYGARKGVAGLSVEDVGKGKRTKSLSPLEQARERLEQAKGTPEQAAALRPEEPGFAGNINLSKGEAANVPITEAVMDDPAYSQMAGQRRGVITDAQAIENAKQAAQDRSIEDWLSIKPGTALNEEEALALRSTTERVGNEYRQMQAELLQARTAGTHTPSQEAKLAEKALEFAAMTAVRSGAAAEAGRALRSFRLMLSGEFGSQEAAIKKAFEVLGGGDSFTKWVDEFNKIDPLDRTAQIRHLQKLHEPTIWEKLNAYRYANMLSSWKTHQVNTISNAMEAVSRPIETALAGYPKEAAADVYGMMRGIPEGLQSAMDALKTGVSKYETSKLETGIVRPRPLGYSKFGRAVAMPSDLLIAADDFWKSVNYSGAIHTDAYRLAKGNVARAEELVTKPTDAMIERAQHLAKYATYQNDPNEFVKRIVSLANTPGPGGFVFKLFVPFIRTPANIYTRGLGMILQPLSGPVKMGIKAAKGDTRAVRLEAAKTAIAGSTLAGLWGLAASGNLTGQGPSDPAKRRILEESGWQSNSIKVGDRWLRYSNLGPVSIPMAAVAAVKEGLDEGKRPNREMMTDAANRVYNSMLDVSFVQGLSDLLRGEGIVGGLAQVGVSAAGSFVPYSAGLAAVERISDPNMRAKDDPLAAVQGRIPIASQLLPTEPSIYGGTRQQGEGDTLAQILLPWPTSKERQDPVASEVARLNQSDEARHAGVTVSVRQFGETYAGAKQTPEQRRTLQGEAGKLAAAYIADMISRPAYQKLNDVQKATTLNKALSTAYEIADLQLGEQLNRDPRHQALLAWATVPQYEGVKGTPEEVRLENYEIAQAKAKRVEYRKQHGDADLGDYKLMKEDKKAYQLAQRARLDNDYLKLKKKRVDEKFGGALSQAEREGLVGAGNTILPVGSGR